MVSVELHGFTDAPDPPVPVCSYNLPVMATRPVGSPLSKSKVSIPMLELCGASLLSKVLTTVRKSLKVPLDQVHAWSVSSIVIAWLDGRPKRYRTYIGNRIASITSLVPPSLWKHVPTNQNPADCASRGMSPLELRDHIMWWNSTAWLALDPVQVPNQPLESELTPLRALEAKPVACNPIAAATTEWIESRYSSYRILLHVTAWMLRISHNLLDRVGGQAKNTNHNLTPSDIQSSETFLFLRSQQRSFPDELARLKSIPSQPLQAASTILPLNPFCGTDGLLHVGGHLSHVDLLPSQKDPVICDST